MTTDVLATIDELLVSLQSERSSGVFSELCEHGIFCMPQEYADRALAQWSRGLRDNSQQAEQRYGNAGASIDPMKVTSEGVAIVRMAGVMAKVGNLNWGVVSTVEAQQQLFEAAQDKAIRGVLYSIESPGGTAAGTAELADAVKAVRRIKPVWTQVTDIGASAAVWPGVQAEKVFANPTALFGSIGTYSVVPDYSKFYEKLGIKVEVFRAGEMKGAGTPGTEITPEQREEFQKIVDSLNEFFLKDVARGRNLPIARVRELADGRIHIASKALELGLIDGVQSQAQTLAQLTKHVSPVPAGRSKSAMSDTSAAPMAASFRELKMSLPGADAEFIATCQEKELTLDSARSCWMTTLSDRLFKSEEKVAELTSQNATLQAELDAEKAKPKSTRPGAPALADSGNPQPESSGDPVAAWQSAIDAEMAKGKSKAAAVEAVVASQPHVHRAFVEATQPGR